MKERKTKQVAKVTIENYEYRVIFVKDSLHDHYKVTESWYDCGWHTKTIDKYDDLYTALSVIAFLAK